MDADTLVKQAFKNFTPPKRQKISEWAEANFELPETSAEPGKWHPSRAPYQVGILDAISEPGIQKVSLMCSAQIGKTVILLIIICYLIDLDPCSILMTQPTTDMAEIFSKEKLSSAIANVKPVTAKIAQKSRDATSTILMKMFAGGFLRLAGANSPSSLASMSIRAYFGDEIDKYPASAGKEGDPVKLAIQRTETFWNWLVFLVSTPSILENSRIEDEFEQSDKRRYFVPCPHCGQGYRFSQSTVWSLLYLRVL
jgi:phage terminase large subunit GpA-like protein